MEPVIALEDVCFSYRKHFWRGPLEILKAISFSVNKGAIAALLGPEGAGKTTTLKIITGLLRPTRGRVRIFGMGAKDLAVKRRIGFLPEAPFFYQHLTGYEFLRLHEHLSGHDDTRGHVYEVLTRIGLKGAADTPLRNFSRNMLQRIGFAQACVNDPDLLLLDQPFDCLDPIERRGMKHRMLEVKQRGGTILFSSRILPDIVGLCDCICVIKEGKILQTGDPAMLFDGKIDPEQTTIEQWLEAIAGRS